MREPIVMELCPYIMLSDPISEANFISPFCQ
jgi:hypothetical protein